MATCTGLSIMLVESCRSVGVLARLVGIHSWPGRGGNHAGAEVWDGGLHFVGAAEPDEKGLDHTWFVGDAAKAIKVTPKNAIYADTYRSTGDHFPLAWDAPAKINAENVTDRYKGGAAPAPTRPRLAVLASLLADRFGVDASKRDIARKHLAEVPFDDKARDLAWQAYKTSPVHEPLREEFRSKTVTTPDRTSPYLWRHVGKEPKDGWSLVIAMHGGGGGRSG